MKKLLFMCAIAAAAVLTSCEEKVNRQQIVGNIYTEDVKVDGGVSHKLVLATENSFSPISDQLFTEVVYEPKSKLVTAYKGNVFEVFTPEGERRGSGEYEKLHVTADQVYLTGADNKVTLYLPDKGSVFGPYLKISVIGDKIFACGPKGWGLLDTAYNYLQDMVHEQLYIVNMKDSKKYDVLRCRDGKWTMVTSDGAEYDPRVVKAAVKTLEKKVKPADKFGVIEAKL